MEKALVITNEKGITLSRKIATALSEDEAAMLEVWRFYLQPPLSLVIFVDSDYQYGFTEYGDRLGIVDFLNCPGDSLYFEGDNGISYVGSRVQGSNLRFSVCAMEHSVERVHERCKKFLDLTSTI